MPLMSFYKHTVLYLPLNDLQKFTFSRHSFKLSPWFFIAASNTSNSAPKSLTSSSVTIARNKPLTLDDIRNTIDQHITNEVIPKWENEK
jgi:hypothetical protein